MNSFHQQGPPQYEYIYGSTLLDELHNYFPSLLYEQNNFNNIRDVFAYMNQQIDRRFNPFAYGRSRYLAQNSPILHRTHSIPVTTPSTPTSTPAVALSLSPTPTPAPTTPPVTHTHTTRGASLIRANPPAVIRNTGILSQLLNQSLRIPGYNDITYYYDLPAINTNTQAINSIFRQLLQEYDSPVPITPNEDELSAHTTIIRIDDITVQNSCSICQEDYVVGDTIRKINHCAHYFHKSCIDSWFLANARCPVCRHDIRDATP